MSRTLVMLVTLAAASASAGCLGYSTCGTYEWATPGRVDERFDPDGDGDLDLIEACGIDYGAFGFLYPQERIVQLMLDWSEWDTGRSSDLTYDYLPVNEVYTLEEKLVKGAVLTEADVGGYVSYKPSGNPDDLNSTFMLRTITLEVLDGPVDSDELATGPARAWKFRWDATFADGSMQAQGEDWIRCPLWDRPWTAAGHNGNPPGYPRP